MKRTLSDIKKEMAFWGYYNITDFASLQGVTKQYISKTSGKFITTLRHGRRWYKYDVGQHALSIYGTENPTFDKFYEFGFKARTKALAISENVVCDVKKINPEKVSIRFYNNLGDMLCALVNIKDIEIIPNDGGY